MDGIDQPMAIAGLQTTQQRCHSTPGFAVVEDSECNGHGWIMGSGSRACMCDAGYEWAEDDMLTCIPVESEPEYTVGHLLTPTSSMRTRSLVFATLTIHGSLLISLRMLSNSLSEKESSRMNPKASLRLGLSPLQSSQWLPFPCAQNLSNQGKEFDRGRCRQSTAEVA